MGKVKNASGKSVSYDGNRDDWTQGWWEDTDFGEEIMSNGLKRLMAKAQKGKELAVQGMFANSNPNPNPPPPNQPSSEGEYPAVQSSNLEQSMGVSNPAVEDSDVVIAYGANVTGEDPSGERQYEKGYAYYLEVGAPGNNMQPRPYLKLSLEELESEGF